MVKSFIILITSEVDIESGLRSVPPCSVLETTAFPKLEPSRLKYEIHLGMNF